MADKFLDETDFMDRLIFNEKRRSEVFQRIIEKYDREFSDDMEGQAVSLSDVSSDTDETIFGQAISSDSEEEDESIGTGATMVDCPPLLDSTAWKDSNYEVTCTVLHAKIVQIKKEISWDEIEDTSTQNEVFELIQTEETITSKRRKGSPIPDRTNKLLSGTDSEYSDYASDSSCYSTGITTRPRSTFPGYRTVQSCHLCSRPHPFNPCIIANATALCYNPVPFIPTTSMCDHSCCSECATP